MYDVDPGMIRLITLGREDRDQEYKVCSMHELYVAMDGDDVGHHLDYLALLNNVEGLASFSARFGEAMGWLADTLVSQSDATIIFIGGDNLLARLPLQKYSAQHLQELRTEFARRSRSTLSIGVGTTARRAYLALKFTKASGKDRLCHYEEFFNE